MTEPSPRPPVPELPESTTYRLDPAPGLRLFGTRVVVSAVLVVVAGTLLSVFDDGPGRVVAYVVGVVAAVFVVTAVVLLVRPPAVLRLDARGYRAGRIPGAGVREAVWTDVRRVGAQPRGPATALVIELEGGRRTDVPLAMLATQVPRLLDEVNARLDLAHGYRRLS